MFGIVLAFKDYRIYTKDPSLFNNIMHSDWVGLKNFEFIFATTDSWKMIRNTIGYNALWIVLGLIIAVAFAIMLNEIYSRKLSKFYQSAMFLPYFLSWVVFSYLVQAFLSPDKGFLNMSIFKSFGIKSVYWYSEPVYWPYIILLVNAWKWVGNNCIIFLASIIAIDQELYEAARIDGASRWQQIIHITIPQITPVIIVMTLLFVGRIFNTDLGLFMLVPRNSGILSSVTWTIDVYVYNTLIRNWDIGMSSASALFQSVGGFITILLANFAVKKVDRDSAMF